MPLDAGRQPWFWHVGDKVEEQAALAKQGVDALFDDPSPQMAIHAEAFARNAHQCQQPDGEGVQHQEVTLPQIPIQF